jgi:hypothetical protein
MRRQANGLQKIGTIAIVCAIAVGLVFAWKYNHGTRARLRHSASEASARTIPSPSTGVPELRSAQTSASEVLNRSAAIDYPTLLTSLPLDSKPESKISIIAQWAEREPASAAAWVEGNLAGSVRQGALQSLAAIWADKDSSAAAEWARHLSRSDEREAVMVTLAYESMDRNPLGAFVLAGELSADGTRDDLLIHAASAWATMEPQKAAEWANQIPDATFRQRALAGIATAWSDTDPVAAAKLAVGSLPAGRAQDDAVIGILQRWVQKDSEQAAAWAATFPEGKLRETALETVVKLWADKDLAEAGRWVNTISADGAQDAAVAAYVEKVAVQYPAMAAEWAKQIQSDALRYQQMENLGELWLRNDSTAARAWISQASLPEETKSRLLALTGQ